SVGGDPLRKLAGNHVDAAVRRLDEAGVLVVVAAGNSGRHGLLPPATSAVALTVGGVDMHNSPDPAAWRLWHSNWGQSSSGTPTPDLLAPANWLPAPVLPGSAIAREAWELFERRSNDDPAIESRILEQKLITPRYQHVDGTSFAAAIVSGVAACLFEANPAL